MNKFVKLFETNDHGQLLVTMDMAEPSVSIKFDPQIDGVWTVSVDIGSKDEDYDKIQRIFDGTTEQSACSIVSSVKEKLQKQFAESAEY